ncbi:MAG: hypothetical protein ABJN69_07500 [Hellea sp.]
MTSESNARIFGYEIQHIFPREIINGSVQNEAIVRFLTSIGFDIEGKSNKIALLINATTRDAILHGPEHIRAAFLDSGFCSCARLTGRG